MQGPLLAASESHISSDITAIVADKTARKHIDGIQKPEDVYSNDIHRYVAYAAVEDGTRKCGRFMRNLRQEVPQLTDQSEFSWRPESLPYLSNKSS